MIKLTKNLHLKFRRYSKGLAIRRYTMHTGIDLGFVTVIIIK